QVAVYTHTDKDHYHNHIVINSVDLETGKKYQSNKKQRDLVKKQNDNVCREHGLSVTERGTAKMRYTQAEKGIVFDREEYSWKDELRELIENAKTHTSNLETFSEHLEEKGVEVKLRGETISYKPENANKWVRGRTLGSDYEKGAIDYDHERHQEQQRESEYADGFKVNWDAVEQHTEQLKQRRVERAQETKQVNRKISSRDTRESENQRERTQRNNVRIERGNEGISR
ncbi:relaxase/mobilization nuclease domain-containing protein, partial [Staphylococcus saprophyticus]